ncbi:hypothetical protein E4T38_01884 [Aureobasidium subglaciale]|nr:hypothetical protein E4T38_01884 [Aureobasidium subglaciale]KAI5229310.1 hypothetical protein E4T40_01596 [Aureobasidium subglaciale]KAI5233011.1 hypothetical protein E4T41_01882 [Aureobasidium subglaciale]KAI5266406.1 hypothetical protein E4T46_01593 [Aureobasidium subglaciale]
MSIEQGKAKSQKRKEMEEVWGEKGSYWSGLFLQLSSRIFCMKGDVVTLDKYGKYHSYRSGTS